MKLKIFTSPTCGYCDMAKDWLKEKNISYEEVDVAKDPAAAQELVQVSGQMGVPVIIIENNGEKSIVVGFDQGKLEEIIF